MLGFPHPIPSQSEQLILKSILSLSEKLRELPVSHIQQQSIFHKQILKSSLFSAKIEGNTLSLIQAQEIQENIQDLSKEKSKLEISNVLNTLQNIHILPKELSKEKILTLHAQIMKDIDSSAGKFRTESSGIFDGWGNIVYLTPEPAEMHQMLDILLQKINTEVTPEQQLITTAQCHYYYEKIHPFIDGNGRVGRSIIQYQLQKTNLFANYILPIDEFFEENKSKYYRFLEKNSRKTEDFTSFFLEGIEFSLNNLLTDIAKATDTTTPKLLKKQGLLPRRQELLHIIGDHPYISLENLCRRFPTIPKRTIAYDVNWLVKKNLITKHGETRGVRYSAEN